MGINFYRSHIHASISQQMDHNGGYVSSPLQVSGVKRHFHQLGKRSNISVNRNTYQDNSLYTNTLTQEVKQNYPPNTLIKVEVKL